MNRDWMREETVEVSGQYRAMIDRLREDKVEINRKKLEALGSIDIDDHGFIYFPEFSFTPETCEDGSVHGARLIGKNFKRFLEVMPRYVNRNSALAGCWAGQLGAFMNLRVSEECKPRHAFEIFRKYQITQPGFAAMNHLCPDVSIGLKLGWRGLLEKVRYFREKNHPSDTSFYDGEEMLLLGILNWV